MTIKIGSEDLTLPLARRANALSNMHALLTHPASPMHIHQTVGTLRYDLGICVIAYTTQHFLVAFFSIKGIQVDLGCLLSLVKVFLLSCHSVIHYQTYLECCAQTNVKCLSWFIDDGGHVVLTVSLYSTTIRFSTTRPFNVFTEGQTILYFA